MTKKSLRDYRTEAGQSQRQLAKKLKVSAPMVSLWESGKNKISLRFANKLAKTYKVDPSVFGPFAKRRKQARISKNATV